MLATEIIAKKRDNQKLSVDEIRWMIDGMVSDRVADYQISAWAMAILCRGMSASETAALTDSMLASGTRLSKVGERPRVDKHSTGGLGDKTSLILAPLLACCDCDVPMLSGRGLGITGGTLDKLESYDGFRCDLTLDEISRQVEEIGCVITGTTPEITPADRKLYALRDASGTVPSVALITASILSKKLAESLDALVLDVKFGSGAFMRTVEDAARLAKSLRATAAESGLAARVIVSDMNQPLGKMVGNACEANEAVQIIQGSGPADARELTLRLGAELIVAAKRADSIASARQLLEMQLESGKALHKYIQLIESQGGRFTESLPLARPYKLPCKQPGYLASIEGQKLGGVVTLLGGGRKKLGDNIDPGVGLEMHCRLGDAIESGQPICTVFASSKATFESVEPILQSAIVVSPEPAEPPPLIVDIDP